MDLLPYHSIQPLACKSFRFPSFYRKWSNPSTFWYLRVALVNLARYRRGRGVLYWTLDTFEWRTGTHQYATCRIFCHHIKQQFLVDLHILRQYLQEMDYCILCVGFGSLLSFADIQFYIWLLSKSSNRQVLVEQ